MVYLSNGSAAAVKTEASDNAMTQRRVRIAMMLVLFAEFLFKSIGLLHAHSAPYGLAVLEQYKCRDRTHVVLSRKPLILVNIDFNYVCRVSDTFLDIFKNRALHTARATPRGKKVDESRF